MNPAAHRRAFTMIELLLVIAVIFILIAIVATAMYSVRQSANRASTMGALRQMITGYGAYSTDYNGRLMPGYIDSTLINADPGFPEAEYSDESGLSPEASESYVWRIAPYLDYDWPLFYEDFHSRELTSRLDISFIPRDTADAGVLAASNAAAEQISLQPSIGMNSIYVGGDSFHGGNAITDNDPWENLPLGNPDSLAVTSLSNARNPSKLIVFGPAAKWESWMDGEANYEQPADLSHPLGYPELRAPWLPNNAGDIVNQQWRAPRSDAVGEPTSGTLQSANGAGLPVARWGLDRYPVANLDGSTTSESLGALSADMTRWANLTPQELEDRNFDPGN